MSVCGTARSYRSRASACDHGIRDTHNPATGLAVAGSRSRKRLNLLADISSSAAALPADFTAPCASSGSRSARPRPYASRCCSSFPRCGPICSPHRAAGRGGDDQGAAVRTRPDRRGDLVQRRGAQGDARGRQHLHQPGGQAPAAAPDGRSGVPLFLRRAGRPRRAAPRRTGLGRDRERPRATSSPITTSSNPWTRSRSRSPTRES